MYMHFMHNMTVIKTFADKETEKVYHQTFSKKLPQSIQKVALRKRIMNNFYDVESVDYH